jgi:predicted nucleotidyltransferase
LPNPFLTPNLQDKQVCINGLFIISEVKRLVMPRMAKTETAQAHIDRMVKRIVKKFHPEQVILFGSHARGEAGPDSDVDLLVVMPVEGSTFDKCIEIRQALRFIPVPVDVIVTRPEDFAWRRNVVGTIEWPATHEGKVLYVRSGRGRRGDP